MRRIQRYVAEPSANGIDVDARAQQMNGRRVSYRVRAYAFGGQRWHRPARQIAILRHDTVYPEAGQWLVDAIQEDRLGLIPSRQPNETMR